MKLKKHIYLCVITAIFAFTAVPSHAQTIIRDTEIEAILAEWAEPVLKAADIPEGNVNIILVQSPEINAFVAGGANVFLYTGLIEKTENPGELLGVFAHELGHIAGGHLIATRDAMERASYESILGAVVGIGAAILGGGGDAANAVISGSQNVATRRFLANSRVNESAADQAALSYFEKAKFNPDGLATFLEKLEGEELMPASRQSEYVRTHPLTSNRIRAVENRAEQSPYINAEFPEHWNEQHARMKAKLIGFISPGRVAWDYDDRDQSIPARYARAIAAYQQNEVQRAVALADGLIEEEPQNPYFHEIKGQMLVDFARIEESLPAYRKAVDLKPGAALLRIALAHALLQTPDNTKRLEEAVGHLKRALKDEPRSGRAHRLLATAYGQSGRENLAKLHLAEEAILQRRLPYATQLANTVYQDAPDGSTEKLKAHDILDYIKTLNPKGE